MSSIFQQKRTPVQKSKRLAEEKCENRLYVGNIDHRITEYHIIKLFSPFGKICCEEFMWHTRGPKKGEPRGFAFIEFSKREEAEKAKEVMNGRLALGRPLVVRFVDETVDAHSLETSHQSSKPSHPSISSLSSCTASKNSKIAAIRDKLRLMEQEEMWDDGSCPRKRPRLTGMPSSTYLEGIRKNSQCS